MAGHNINRSLSTLLQSNRKPQMSDMESLPVTNKAAGEPESFKNKVLETGAAAVQVHLTSDAYSIAC